MTVLDRYPTEVGRWIAADVFTTVDAELVRTLFERAGEPSAPAFAWLMAGLTLRAYRDGHSRLDLDNDSLLSWRPGPGVPWPGDRAAVEEVLAGLPSVFGTAVDLTRVPRTPFVMDREGLYIAEVLHQESEIARLLTRDGGGRVRTILGGPGTGKTYTIAQMLRTLEEPVPRLALCAPTGKASRHLKTVLDRQLREKGASAGVLAALDNAPSMTVHRLLGYNPDRSPRWGSGPGRPLDFKLVIVDEASMVSLSLMHRLLASLDDDAMVWIVGDPDQLVSVDAGSVLADIERAASDQKCVLHAGRVRLTEQHRFAADSGIAALASAVREGDTDEVRRILESGADDLVWIDPVQDTDRMKALTADVVAHARLVAASAADGQVSAALATKSALQVLSATRVGALGVDSWNELVERELGPATSARNYVGRPVLITRNDPVTGLSNGDVGVVCEADGTVRAWFGDPQAPVDVSMARLPDTSTVHALTIHKSQGSEYDHAIVVIPSGESRILTRELLYTGITRPRTKLTLVATWASIETAVETQVRRATGLEMRLAD